MNNINKILVHHLCKKYLILSTKFYDKIISKISNPIIVNEETDKNFTDKTICIFNWENFSTEFKLKCANAEKIIIFSDTLKPTFVFETEKKKNNIVCRLCYEHNTFHKTDCCKQELHLSCFSNWTKSCPFCRHENYKSLEIF